MRLKYLFIDKSILHLNRCSAVPPFQSINNLASPDQSEQTAVFYLSFDPNLANEDLSGLAKCLAKCVKKLGSVTKASGKFVLNDLTTLRKGFNPYVTLNQ